MSGGYRSDFEAAGISEAISPNATINGKPFTRIERGLKTIRYNPIWIRPSRGTYERIVSRI